MSEQTLSIIKPDAVKKNAIGAILARFESAKLKIVAARMVHLSKEQAESFYAIHKGKPFFSQLVSFMISAPVLVLVLEGDEAVKRNREIMGATNPNEALAGTLRYDYATSIDENSVHGSDSQENAKKEISFFFSPDQIFSR